MNVDVPCPSCGTQFTVRRELLGKRTKCPKCGHAFVIAEAAAAKPAVSAEPSATVPPAIFPEIKTAPPAEALTAAQVAIQPAATRRVPNRVGEDALSVASRPATPRFHALRMVARAYEIMAVLTFAIGVILVVVLFVMIIQRPGEILAVLFTIGLPIFWTLASALMFLFFAQSIRLGLQVEENTREAHRACRELADHLCGIESEQ